MNQDAQRILQTTLREAMPGAAVGQALDSIEFPAGRLVLVAAGKAAWEMASAAYERLGGRVDGGVVITKYGHSRGAIGGLEVYEAGHPVPDENSYRATARAMETVGNLHTEDSVLFLLSGGGSALFEQPLIPAEEMADLTRQLLACGADIVEINTLRKRLSGVKLKEMLDSMIPGAKVDNYTNAEGTTLDNYYTILLAPVDFNDYL